MNLSVNGVKRTAFQQELGKNDVCVSVKSACSVEGTPSKAVYAVSRDRKNALSSWRISLSHLTTEAEIAEFLQIFDRCYRELAAMNAPPRRKRLEKRELSMPRTLEPYQMIERSIIKKYRDELWKPFV